MTASIDIHGAATLGIDKPAFPRFARWRTVVIAGGLFYVGLSALFFRRLDIYIAGRIPLIYLVGVICAALGYRAIAWTPLMRRYIAWAIALCTWVLLSSVAAWEAFRFSFHYSRTFVLTFAVLVPVFAGLTRRGIFRHALLGGFAATAGYLSIVACYRLALGRPVYEDTGGYYPQLFGTGRNAINALLLATLPWLVTNDIPRVLAWLRWLLIPAMVVLIVSSGGRTGLAGLTLAALVFFILEPGVTRRLRAICLVVVAGTSVLLWVSQASGPSGESYQRISSFFEGTRTSSDEIRDLLLKKSWDLAADNPLFGVGYGRFSVEYSPVVERAETAHVREQAAFRDTHNAYAQLMAEAGFPALVLFVGLLLCVVRAGWNRRRDGPVRMGTLAFVGTAAQLVFMNLSVVGVLYIPMALLLGRLAQLDAGPEDPEGGAAGSVA